MITQIKHRVEDLEIIEDIGVKAKNVISEPSDPTAVPTKEQMTNWDNKLDVDDPIVFETATARKNINTGENLTTLLGKIKRFFSDLKTVAFSGSYTDLKDCPVPVNNCDATIPGSFFDAAQGKILMDRFGGVYFSQDADGNIFVTGADTVPKKLGSGGLTRIVLGKANTSTRVTFDVGAVYADYENLTSENFAYSSCGATKRGAQGENNSTSHYYNLVWDNTTGALTCIPYYKKDGESGEGYGSGPDIDEPDILLFAPEI